MADLRVTKPCRRCIRRSECDCYLSELRALVNDHTVNTAYALPDVVVECFFYEPVGGREHPRRE
jgi:hypothetical protein